MKPYGLERQATCNRKIRGTSRNCPCCTRRKQWQGHRSIKKQARRQQVEYDPETVEVPKVG